MMPVIAAKTEPRANAPIHTLVVLTRASSAARELDPVAYSCRPNDVRVRSKPIRIAASSHSRTTGGRGTKPVVSLGDVKACSHAGGAAVALPPFGPIARTSPVRIAPEPIVTRSGWIVNRFDTNPLNAPTPAAMRSRSPVATGNGQW